VRQVGHLLKLM